MGYEINISDYYGKHTMATHTRSASCINDVKELLKRLVIAFPPADGYSFSVAYVQTTGEDITHKFSAILGKSNKQ